MDIKRKRYPFALLLGLSLAIHLLVLLIWPALQPQPIRLALPSADFSIHLQDNDAKPESIPVRPVSKLATAKPVPVPVMLRAKSDNAHEALQTAIKTERTTKETLINSAVRGERSRNFTVRGERSRNFTVRGERSRTMNGKHHKIITLRTAPFDKALLSEAKELRSSPPDSRRPSAKTVSGISQNRVISRLQLELKQYFYYPRLAQRQNIQGTVILGFAINLQGTLTNIRIVKSSGFAVLDIAAEDALQKLHQLDWDQDRDRHYLQRDNSDIKLPVIYKLTES